jgi:hypothetical protein
LKVGSIPSFQRTEDRGLSQSPLGRQKIFACPKVGGYYKRKETKGKILLIPLFLLLSLEQIG